MAIFNNKSSKVLCFLGIYFILDCLLGSVLINTRAEHEYSRHQNKADKISYQGLPHNRKDGGSRGNCIARGRDFVALVPDRAVNKTASASPEIFFYVPKTQESKDIEFLLRNEEDELIYKTLVKATSKGGIMSVKVPELVKESAKESSDNFHWYLSLICDNNKRSQDIVLEGWIEYVELNNSLKDKINLSNSIKKANLYQQEEIWYDALLALAEQKKSNSNQTSIQTEWSQMLESVGLSDLASKPIIEVELVKE
ncbi:MAG: DUF928 domain-containing protein [Xenococcaceae cyanobacterium MO_188.B19]|nr:DUF928 domain-containing protein [Xenococcaceae cyanobacterium MO_188.B19]